MKSHSIPLGRNAGLVLACLTFFVFQQLPAQDVGGGEAPFESGTVIEIVTYGEGAYWILPTKRSDRVKPRFLDDEGLLKEIEKIQEEKKRGIRVVISATESTPSGHVAAAMDICAKAGIEDVALSVKPDAGRDFANAEVPAVAAAELAVVEGDDQEGEPDTGATRLSSRVEGFVLRVAVRAGDKVEEGQVLLVIDPSEHELLMRMAEAKIKVAKSGIEISEATCELARGALDSLAKLAEGGVISAGEKERAAFNLKTAEAELRGKLAMLEIAEAEARLMGLYLERCHVRSPVAGTVSEVAAHVGEAVGKGQILLRLAPAK